MRLAASFATWILAMGAAAGADVPAPPAVPATLEELMGRMAGTTGIVATFEEHKHLALLEEPVESRGRLAFVPPSCMVWNVRSPGESSLVIEGERVRFRDETSPQALDLSDNPIARHFVDGFMVLFNGDLSAMREQYALEFRGRDDGWRLALTPRSARVRSVIASIVLEGRSGPIDRMEIFEADGDRTVTEFAAVEVDHRFDPDELRELFGPRTSCGSP